MICHERRFIFVHIRKTGGTSLEAALVHGAGALSRQYRPGGNEPVPLHNRGAPCKHRLLCEYGRREIEEYFTFSIVRNPWDRALSRYCWERLLRRRSVARYGAFRDYILARRGLPPSDWNVDGDNPRKYTSQYASLELDGRIGVERVLRYERLEDEVRAIAGRLGLTGIPLPRVFTSEHEHYASYYDGETREIVADAYRVDVEAFGYDSFDELWAFDSAQSDRAR